MKKSLKKDKKTFTMVITYLMMFVVGLTSMMFPGIGFNNPVLYSSVIFYVVAFFGIFGYFRSNGENKDYELLFFSLINIITASYLFISEFSKASFALGTGFLIFMALESVNKIYFTRKMKKSGTQLWMLRAISIILIMFLSILTIQNFYRALSDVQTVMIGYYFLTFGLISAAELILVTQVSEKAFESILNGQFEELKKEKRLKLKKINENVDELDKIAKNIVSVKKKRK